MGSPLRRPFGFALQVFKDFRANQGFLLAGAVAYYTLLSVVPLFILVLLVLSHLVDRSLVIVTLARYLSMVVPGETELMLDAIDAFVAGRGVYGAILLATLLFFSSMAFSTLEDAISIIFLHRTVRRRHAMLSALLPYLYVALLMAGLAATTLVASILQGAADDRIVFLGRPLALDRLSVALLRTLGFIGEALLLTTVYLTMPVGRVPVRHALLGGLAAASLWEIVRRLLVWYFANLSTVDLVYGSLTAPIVALLTLEVGAVIVLLGAQVIATYERRQNLQTPV